MYDISFQRRRSQYSPGSMVYDLQSNVDLLLNGHRVEIGAHLMLDPSQESA